MINAFVVVWRESLEALLVISVLLAWIARQGDPGRLRRGVWAGLGGGVALAAALGAATFAAQSQLQGQALEAFQAGIALASAALVLQMVAWMRRHGAGMKRELEARAASASGATGVALVTAFAVAREGAETVVFLYGIGLERDTQGALALLAGAAAGLAAALLCAWAIARGARRLNMRTLLRTSELLLLAIATAMVGHGVERLIGMGWLPPLADPLWDSAALLDDAGGIGRVLADFAGYRARPTGALVAAYLLFWGVALVALRPRPVRPKQAPAH
ncbi:MAG: FTR1 family protein [Rubrivivax sp.]